MSRIAEANVDRLSITNSMRLAETSIAEKRALMSQESLPEPRVNFKEYQHIDKYT